MTTSTATRKHPLGHVSIPAILGFAVMVWLAVTQPLPWAVIVGVFLLIAPATYWGPRAIRWVARHLPDTDA